MRFQSLQHIVFISKILSRVIRVPSGTLDRIPKMNVKTLQRLKPGQLKRFWVNFDCTNLDNSIKYSLDYPNGDEQDFESVFSRQYDGRFLIDGMWSTFE